MDMSYLLTLIFFVIASILFYDKLRRNRAQQQLVKQNLIYLVAFVNLLTWLKDSYKSDMMKLISNDPELLEFLTTSGTSVKLFLEKIDRPVTIMHNTLSMRGEEVLDDLKKPLQKEINDLLN
jgi:hypothetical protein